MDLMRLADEMPFDGEALPGFNYDLDWKLVKIYAPRGEDGEEVKVYVLRMPARSRRVVCEAEGIDAATGTGMDKLAEEMAMAIAAGRLGNGFEAMRREIEI